MSICSVKTEREKFIMQKKQLFFFWNVIIFLLIRDKKTKHSKQCPKQKFGVARKTILCQNKKFGFTQKVIWCRQKQVDVARKIFRVNKKRWCCTKNVFHVDKSKIMRHQKIFWSQKSYYLFLERHAITSFSVTRPPARPPAWIVFFLYK